MEVETPVLTPQVIPESNIPLMHSNLEQAGKAAQCLYLLPSPEYYMKQLLAQGWGSMFQYARSFRNGDSGSRLHSPEFTMLEFYWVDHNYFHNMELTERMLGMLAEKFMGRKPHFQRMSMENAFRIHAGISLADLCSEGDVDDIKDACRSLDISFGTNDTWESLFNRIFLNCVEAKLSPEKSSDPLFLYDYPAKIQSLSRNKHAWTERWELYWQGIELANCYTEETSREEIMRFFEHEIQALSADNTLVDTAVGVNVDSNYADKVQAMPPCSGVALGLDRLVMILTNTRNIREVVPFPLDT